MNMQEARIREAQEYLRMTRRVIQLGQHDVVIHRADNGWVVSRPAPTGFITEQLFEDDNESPGVIPQQRVTKSLLRALSATYPDHISLG